MRKGVGSMTENVIITIGRQYGSGGREIGIRLAKKLEIPLYDHNLVAMAAKELGISEKEAKEADETALEHFAHEPEHAREGRENRHDGGISKNASA